MIRTRSEDAFKTARQFIPGGVNSPVRAFRGVGGEPFFVNRANGSRIWDIDGNEYIDYVGTWGPAILGHAPEVVIRAINDAAKNGVSFGIPNPLEIEMARMICEWVPSIEKVRMVNSGTEATMSCIRLSRGFTRRDKIIKFEGCYHGHVDSLLVKAGSGALTHGEPDSAGIPKAFADLTITLPFNDEDALKTVFALDGSEIACVILEPVPANAGLFFPRPGFLELLRRLCSENGAVLIFDEVMTGFRVARGGVQERMGVTPDLTALGKVIGGGLPVGAFGGRAEIMDCLSPDGPVYQAGTLSGNPVAMASGIATLTTLKQTNPYPRLESIAQTLVDGLSQLARDAGIPHTIPHVGSMFTLFFNPAEVTNLAVATQSDTKRFARYFHAMLERGIYLACSQYEANFISAMHTQEDIQKTLDAAQQSFELISQS